MDPFQARAHCCYEFVRMELAKRGAKGTFVAAMAAAVSIAVAVPRSLTCGPRARGVA